MIDLSSKRIIISRTDSIGDVMLTLPLCAWLKATFPTCKLIFLGSSYTQPIIASYPLIDEFADWSVVKDQTASEQEKFIQDLQADVIVHVFPSKRIAKAAKKAKIQERIGTSHRFFHLLTCNHRLNFTRKNSPFHESQLNFELLRPFGLLSLPSLEEIIKYTAEFKVPSEVILPQHINERIQAEKKAIILHPKSQGSAIEWPISKYMQLAIELANANCQVFFTGTEKEGVLFRGDIPIHPNIVDTTGQLSLRELIVFIDKVDALVACSTGPLHIAGYLGKQTIGFYSPRIPIHPGRWKALGQNVQIVEFDPSCPSCAAKNKCLCLQDISVSIVLALIQKNV